MIVEITKKEAKRLYDIEYRLKNKNKIAIRKRKWFKANPEIIKKSRIRNKHSKKISDKKYADKNKNKVNNYKKSWALDNPDKVKLAKLKYNEANKDKRAKKERERKQTDSLYKLKCNIRISIGASIRRRGFNKTSKTEIILGCSIKEFKIYLESKFESWMNWDNYGKYNGESDYGWDIDHIKPIALAINESMVIELNHYSNLQPLCSYINRDVKRDIVIHHGD